MTLLQKFLTHGELEYTHKKLGLGRMVAALELLGTPHQDFPAVLIAGTNGKGSVGRMLESVLVQAGYPVGLYTSPHLERFTERIRVAGEETKEEELEEILEWFQRKGLLRKDGALILPGGDTLTWFEKTTLLAFEVFRSRKIPLGLLEVGLGARLDATNVVDSLFSIITSVSLDHTEVLGNSVFEIAREKLAVMRKGKLLILGPMDPRVRTFLAKAARMGEALPVTPRIPSGSTEDFSYGPLQNLSLGLQGAHQLKNAATVLEAIVALQELGFNIENRHVREGLAKVVYPGRTELFPGWPPVLLDGAHNEESLQALGDYLKEKYPKKKITIILGMMNEKDPKTTLKLLSPLNPRFIFTEVKSPRSLSLIQWHHWSELLKIGGEFADHGHEALKKAFSLTEPEDLIVVTGSLYLVGELRQELSSQS